MLQSLGVHINEALGPVVIGYTRHPINMLVVLRDPLLQRTLTAPDIQMRWNVLHPEKIRSQLRQKGLQLFPKIMAVLHAGAVTTHQQKIQAINHVLSITPEGNLFARTRSPLDCRNGRRQLCTAGGLKLPTHVATTQNLTGGGIN